MSAAVNTNNPQVSLILPVFNVVAYIDECLQSILDQDFGGGLEAIMIDDASTDGSVAVCRRYAEDYPRHFRLIECASNAGVSVARNLGLEQAGGQYLAFVDPDDILPPTAVSSLYAAALKYDADIVKGNLVLFDENERRPAPDRVRNATLIEGEAVLETLFEHALVRGHIGGKLFRRQGLGDLRFLPGVRMAQDLLYFSEMFSRAGSLALIDDEVYFYRKHGTGSTGRKYEKGSYVDWLGAVENSGRFAASRGQRKAHKNLLLRTMAQIAREARKIDPEHAREVLQTIEQRCHQWHISLLHLLVIDRLGPRSISRYIKLQLALGKIRQILAKA